MIDLQKIYKFADELFLSLSPSLIYHNKAHTDDVREAAKNLAVLEKMSADDIILIDIAALFHDIGHVESYGGHEEVAIKLLAKQQKDFDLSNEELEKVSGMIRATKLPQDPQSKMEMIICDADLDNFGRDDCLDIFEKIFIEKQQHGYSLDKKEWIKQTIFLMEQHFYFTSSAQALRNDRKKTNIMLLKKKLHG